MVLFDLDGTLLDTAPDLAHALNYLLERRGYPALPLERVRPYASCGSAGLIKLGFGIDSDHPDYPDLRIAFFEIYHAYLTANTTLFPDAEFVLRTLEGKGIKWGVVTNKPTDLSVILLEYFRLARRAACIIGADQVPRRKPAPDGLMLACQQTGYKPNRCLYVGDAERDILAAQAAGMRSVAVTYGYTLKNEDPRAWKADFVIDSLKELVRLI